jgi:RNA polymerase sigma factor for flagellar operon FliA
MKAHLAEAVSKLSEREQLILSLYYREELTMKEIAEVVGIALSRVSQIRQATMIKLRKSLAHVHDQPTATRVESTSSRVASGGLYECA